MKERKNAKLIEVCRIAAEVPTTMSMSTEPTADRSSINRGGGGGDDDDDNFVLLQYDIDLNFPGDLLREQLVECSDNSKIPGRFSLWSGIFLVPDRRRLE